MKWLLFLVVAYRNNVEGEEIVRDRQQAAVNKLTDEYNDLKNQIDRMSSLLNGKMDEYDEKFVSCDDKIKKLERMVTSLARDLMEKRMDALEEQMGHGVTPDSHIAKRNAVFSIPPNQTAGLDYEALNLMVQDDPPPTPPVRPFQLQQKEKPLVTLMLPLNDTLEKRVEKLESLTRMHARRSCYDYFRLGINESGNYFIDPDGVGIGLEPFEVYCNKLTGATEISHDSENLYEIPHCGTPFCFTRSLNYQSSLAQITGLVSISEKCEQDFKFECRMAPLSSENKPYAHWATIQAQPSSNFHGPDLKMYMCKCGFYSNCTVKDKVCNCDATGIPALLSDEGTITNTSALPVTSFSYGNLHLDASHAKFAFGPLKCFGGKEVREEEIGSSCKALKIQGESRSGYYTIRSNVSSSEVSVVLCRFDLPDDDERFQTLVGHSDYGGKSRHQTELQESSGGFGSSGVFFEVKIPRSLQDEFIPKGNIIFTKATINLGNAMDLEKGTFTVPKDGVYAFFFNAEAQGSSYAHIIVELNGADVLDFFDHPGNTTLNERQFTFYFVLDLSRGDFITLFSHYSDAINVYTTPVSFMGFLVH